MKAETEKSRVGDRQTNQDEKFYAIGMAQLPGLGPVNCRKLYRKFGSAKALFSASPKDLDEVKGLSRQTRKALWRKDVLRKAEDEMRFAELQHISVDPIFSKSYPNMLRSIHDAPFVIFQKGNVDLNREISVAVVGTRRPSSYGRMIAEKFARYFSERGINVVSGLAFGIDGAAHGAALETGGRTTAVLGHGLQTVYPREHSLQARNICDQGALVTEFGSSVGPEGRNFPLRNRIISGLCHATIVIEAGIKGGALITAKSAFEQNREVYAVPGDISRATSVGCNQLIRDQIAKILTDPGEVLEDIAPMLEKKAPFRRKRDTTGLDQFEKQVLEVLGDREMSVWEIGERVNVGHSKAHALVLGLELKKFIFQIPGGRYRRNDA